MSENKIKLVNNPRVYIVEDESIIREVLKYYLNTRKITVIGETDNCNDAVREINERKPDIVFLDISLRQNDNGLDVLAKINYCANFFILTAWLKYSLPAFESNLRNPSIVWHYLKKPIDFDELNMAISKIFVPYLLIEKKEETRSIPLSSIIMIIQNDHYTNFYCSKVSGAFEVINTVYSSLIELKNELPSDSFIQINRSVIIHKLYIEGILDKGKSIKLKVDLKQNDNLKIGKTFKVNVLEELNYFNKPGAKTSKSSIKKNKKKSLSTKIIGSVNKIV